MQTPRCTPNRPSDANVDTHLVASLLERYVQQTRRSEVDEEMWGGVPTQMVRTGNPSLYTLEKKQLTSQLCFLTSWNEHEAKDGSSPQEKEVIAKVAEQVATTMYGPSR